MWISSRPFGVEVRPILRHQTAENRRRIWIDGDAVVMVAPGHGRDHRAHTARHTITLVLVKNLEPERGIEPLTYALRVRCSAD